MERLGESKEHNLKLVKPQKTLYFCSRFEESDNLFNSPRKMEANIFKFLN